MNVVELFSGNAIISNEFKLSGHNTFSIDVRRRKGVCEPDLKKDIMQLRIKDIPFKKVDVIWASPPCDVWSYAAGSFHWNDNKPRTFKCLNHIKLLDKTLTIIEKLCPGLFFIENPRGRLRYYKGMIDFLIKNRGMIKEITYSSYGFPTTKPTDIFTNAIDYMPKELDKFGRGAKVDYKLDNFSKCQKQKVPGSLAKEIRRYCEEKCL